MTEPNPAARLDFWRFQSEQVAAYDRMQCEIIRRHSPGRWITHNFMGLFNDFDHWPLGAQLDFASWDSYPIGLVEHFPFEEAERLRWQDASHPDIAPFHHDLYRGVGRGRFWVMEQQPGPVNWARWNPAPARGMVRLWTLEAHAHGAEVVSYFRWRQAPFAQEQMHAGLNLPGSHELSPGGREAAEAAGDLARLGDLPATARAPAAIVYDYEAHWITAIEPQGEDFRYPELVFRWYEAIRRLGLDVDFVAPGASLDDYRLVLAPVPADRFGGRRAGFRRGDRNRRLRPAFRLEDAVAFRSLRNCRPGRCSGFLRSRVIEVSSMRPGVNVAIAGAITGHAERWREAVETRAETLATFADGAPALIASDNYLLSRLLARRRRARLADGALVPKGGPLDHRAAGRSAPAPPRRPRLRLQLRRNALAGAFRRRAADRGAERGAEGVCGVASLTVNRGSASARF